MIRSQKTTSYVGLFALAAGMLSLSAFAGPVEDARALIRAGKPGEVDEKLGALLDRSPVPMDVLQVSFDAAIAAGRPYTAERRYSAMVDKKEDLPLATHFKAAFAARDIGKRTLCRDRLVFFLGKDRGWNENVEIALSYLCRDGGDPEHFERYMQHRQVNDATFYLGLSMLEQMRTAKRMAEYVKQADVLLGKFTRQDYQTRVLADVTAAMPSFPDSAGRKAMMAALAKHPVAANPTGLRLLRSYGEFNAPMVIDYCVANKVLLPADIFRRVQNLVGDVNDAAAREAFAPKMKQLEPLVKAPGATEQLFSYYQAIIANKEFYNDPAAAPYKQAELATLFATIATAWYNQPQAERLRSIALTSADGGAWAKEHTATMIKTYPKLFDYRHLIWDTKIADQARAGKTTANLRAVLAAVAPERTDIRWQALGVFCDIANQGVATPDDKNLVKEIVSEQILARPADFDADNAARYFLCYEGLSVPERVAHLRGLFAKTGYSDAWKRLAAFQALSPKIKDDANYQAFVKAIVPDAKGSDPIAGACAAIARMNREGSGLVPAAAWDLAKKAVAAYNGALPDPKRPVPSTAMMSIWNKLFSLVQKPEDRNRLFLVFAKAFGPAFDSNQILQIANNSANLTNQIAAAALVLKAGTRIPDEFSGLRVPAGLPSSVLSAHYKDMSPAYAGAYVTENCKPNRWPLDTQLKELNALLDAHPVSALPSDTLIAMLGVWDVYARTNSNLAKIPLEKLAAAVLDGNQASAAVRARLMGVFASAGQREQIVARVLASAKKFDPATRYNLVFGALGDTSLAPLESNDQKKEPGPQHFGTLLGAELVPALKAVPLKDAPLLRSFNAGTMNANLREVAYRVRDNSQAESTTAAYHAFAQEVGLRVPHGLRGCDDSSWMHYLYRDAFEQFATQGRGAAAAGIALGVGSSYRDNLWNAQGDIFASLDKAMKANVFEPSYIIVNSMSSSVGDVSSRAQRLRAECATHMPGIYPVAENSPLYPLYVAADELERSNSERAWALLQKNLQTFEREAGKLPPDFVAWGVEQLRHARGAKDALLLRARQIATQLLSNESSLTSELAASLMLTRAECYRDQRNYEAARLEYQSIRNGKKYQGTKAARKAMFRDVDLLIEMGNVSQAEQLVEYWLSQPDVEIQAQAHYFLARIAFERKDFEETRKQLDETFNLDFTHTDARLLHGAWKLATNNEVDDTKVIIGDISDRTLIRPGQELSVSVQDRNLGVAGDGGSIPIIIKTSPGGDSELINLYPSVRNPYLFNGSISTALGVANPTNRILEVFGNDEVVYFVEPEFLRVRGLTTTEPKRLRIVDDARLAIGGAAPLADEDKAEADLERQLLSNSTEQQYGQQARLTNRIKPGNPIYVVVRDRDRSVNSEPNELTVDAKTSSGDRLVGVVLRETEGFSGVFRGEIKTALPPPRAFASDSATGINPGDTINSKRNGVWKSAPDGAQGKWIEVDTMGSHSVSNVAIIMPDPSIVKSISLSGQLIDETVRLGSLPQEDINKRFGLRYQVSTGRKLNQESAIRTAFTAKNAPAPKNVAGLAFTPVYPNRDAAQNAYLTGAIQVPAGVEEVTFHFVARDTKGRTLAGLWMAMAIDGVTVFSGQGNSLHNRSVTIDTTPGAHQLEVFFSANYPDDALDILVEDKDGKVSPFPAAWTDPKQSPALAEFVRDRAEIKRTKNGFEASFAKPVRVRSLRWTFLDYTGRELSVQKLYVQDDKGKLIIPVESDYSDALSNDTLEVAPGDNITVSYNDERTSSGEKRVLEKAMSSSFNDASVHFFFEQIVDTDYGNKLFLYDAYRFLPGDMLLMSVLDPDADISPEADTIKVRARTQSGREQVFTLTEVNKRYDNVPRHVPEGIEGIHGGHFLGQLRTCAASDTNAAPSILRVAPGDIVTLSYFDRENTKPGVPVERTASVRAAQPATPELTLFDTSVTREEDTSVDAKLRLAQIRRRPGNERIEKLYRDQLRAKPMDAERVKAGEGEGKFIEVNENTPVPVMVTDASRARHEASAIMVEAVSGSELADAEMSGRDPEVARLPLKLGVNFKGFRTDMGRVDAKLNGVFSGLLALHLGPPDPSIEVDPHAPPVLSVNGDDTIRLRILDENGQTQIERTLKLVSAARLGLMDSTYTADRESAHVGERFFVMVEDFDQDKTEELDQVAVTVAAQASKVTRKLLLKETLPHSGVFTGTLRPVIFAPGEAIPAVATGGVAVAEADLADDRIAVRYGDTVKFTYVDERTIPGKEPGPIEVVGKVFKGSDGDVRIFSKRFRDNDMAVLVQFRLAECLFETAKEHRKLKQPERSAEAIEQGKFILEEALRNYPTTSHIVEGEFLLANLYQELAIEQKEAKQDKAAQPLFAEALSRFSSILSTWPDDPKFAARAQYHKAFCLEMLGDYNRASEEYVKMTYLYPESPLVGDACIRLATYYYKEQKRYDISGRIYANFQKRFPTHEKADRALFMSAQCHMKQAQTLLAQAKAEKRMAPTMLANEEYMAAVSALDTLIETYRDTASTQLRAQAMYWAGDASLRAKDYEKAFLYLKRTVFEYPETEWARRARGLLLQEAKAFEKLE